MEMDRRRIEIVDTAVVTDTLIHGLGDPVGVPAMAGGRIDKRTAEMRIGNKWVPKSGIFNYEPELKLRRRLNPH